MCPSDPANPYSAFPAGQPDDAREPGDARPDAAAPSPTAAEPPAPRARIRLLAIAIGSIIDIGATLVLTIAATMVIAGMLVAQGHLDANGLMDTLMAPPMQAAFMFMGATCSMLGGFVCGVIARGREIHHGLLQVVVVFGLGQLLMVVSPKNDDFVQPLWLEIAGYLMLPPSILLGSYLAALRRQRRAR